MRCFLACLLFLIPQSIKSEPSESFLERCYIEIVQEQKIVHLSGTPYEIGYQHGKLLKNEITQNIERFITPLFASNRKKPPIIAKFLSDLPKIITHIPHDLMEEMQGIADGSEQALRTILIMNLMPEMFHCTGITANGNATANGELYHVRVLDYAKGVGLQNTAILAVIRPEHGIPFVNVTYAGFVGCVTGINLQKISIGEIGGKGYGHWDGVPMAFLLRNILQHASNLDEIKEILSTTARTCEYFYVFSDGKTGESFGCYTTPTILSIFLPGDAYRKYPVLPNTFDLTYASQDEDEIEFYQPPENILMISRWDHFNLLKERLLNLFGKINVENLQEAIKEPIAHPSNLHNVIFAPQTLDLWISHAGPNNEPAFDQPYQHLNLADLMEGV